MMKLLMILQLGSFCVCEALAKQPNIIIVMADDLGWNDVSFHGSNEIISPNIDALAYNGVILNRFYTPPLCTPSRSSFMTGKYATKIGMNNFVIPSDEPWGLPLSEKTIAEYFKEAGYKTALIGKWHLGFYKKEFTPTFRGFDSHFGYLGPYIGYYDYSLKMHDRNYSRGFDMRKNLSVNYDLNPKPYVTELFTSEAVNVIRHHDYEQDPLFLVVNHLAPHAGNEKPDKPLEAPEEEKEKFKHIANDDRRTLAAMISVMDRGVGEIVSAINEKGIMNNTIILFYSDNGGPNRGMHSTKASNHPLRGQKGSVWEGGCRVVACIYSPLIKSLRRVSNDFIYVTDILPTLAAAANISIDRKIDGLNQWKTISEGFPSPRQELLYNIEDVVGYSALFHEGWKILNGTENMNYSGWLGLTEFNDNDVSFESYFEKLSDSLSSNSLPELVNEDVKDLRYDATVKCNPRKFAISCDPTEKPCLFNIIDDPCEQNNLASSHPIKVEFLLSRLTEHLDELVPTMRREIDPSCDPKRFNNTWTWWQDAVNVEPADQQWRRNYTLVLCFLLLALSLALFVKCTSRSKLIKVPT